MKIQEIEGIGPAYAAKLQQASIATVGDLIEHAATRKGRDELAATTSIDRDLILEWVNHADLMRIKGVGPEYSDLLEAAGVDSPAELAQRNPAQPRHHVRGAERRPADGPPPAEHRRGEGLDRRGQDDGQGRRALTFDAPRPRGAPTRQRTVLGLRGRGPDARRRGPRSSRTIRPGQVL